MEFFDTHCHLDHEYFKNDREEVMGRAREAGVRHWVNLTLSFKNLGQVISLAEEAPECYAAVGIYPRYIGDWQAGDIEKIREAARHEKVVAIGEVGLDYQFNIKASKETQFAVLKAHLRLAAELGLPVLLHNRDLETYHDTLRLVAASPLAGKPRAGVLHDFTADLEVARRALDLGLYISFAGPLTYAGAKKLPGVAAQLPLERILIETDAPCVPPEPYRGLKRSEPAHVVEVARALASIHEKSLEEVAAITTRNACEVFGL